MCGDKITGVPPLSLHEDSGSHEQPGGLRDGKGSR